MFDAMLSNDASIIFVDTVSYYNELTPTYAYIRVIYLLKFFEFRNLQLMRGGPTYMHCIFEEKTKIELEMVDREAGQFWCRLL